MHAFLLIAIVHVVRLRLTFFAYMLTPSYLPLWFSSPCVQRQASSQYCLLLNYFITFCTSFFFGNPQALKLAISIEPPTHSTEELTALRLLLDISSLPPHHRMPLGLFIFIHGHTQPSSLPSGPTVGDTPGIFRKPGSQERVDALYSELTTFGRLPRLEDRLKRNEL